MIVVQYSLLSFNDVPCCFLLFLVHC